MHYGIIAGGRFSKEMIRKGENYSFIEANLYLPDNKNAVDGNIIVTREVYSNGRNSCKINGRLVTVNELKEFMSEIIDIHGQNDNQSLMNPKEHIKFLDNFAGIQLFKIKENYQEFYQEYCAIKKELKNNYGDDKEKQRKLDLLRYQLNEIQQAELKCNEEEKLENDKKLITNSEKIYENLSQADISLSEGAIDAINVAIRSLEKIEEIDEEYRQKLLSLKNIYYDVQELSRDINCLNKEISFDEEYKNEIEERLNLIYFLKRKYGNSIQEILEYSENLRQEIDVIENLEEHNNELKNRQKQIANKMLELANQINKIRNQTANILSDRINKELTDLEMKNAKFSINIIFDEKNEFNLNGLDNVEFLIATNIGEDAKSLIKIASGGESSRIMLAIKTVLADSDEVPILIFDEIDTGISGKAAKSVGEKIKIVSKKHQVLCVTHQASIAAKGDYNYYISKSTNEGKTSTSIKLLSEQEVIEEIARISSGDLTKTAIEYAMEMRKVV